MTRGLLALGAIALGCAGSPPAPAPAPEPAPTTDEPKTETPKPEPEAADEGDAGSEDQPDDAPREVRYILTGGKLEVQANGVRFVPSVKPVKVGGGWGVTLSVEAKVVDDKQHSILESKDGIFAFAGKVTRDGKEPESFADNRKGDDETIVSSAASKKFDRTWPGSIKEKPLKTGDKLELQVGLWGLGDDKETWRPVKKFLIVSMTAGKKPTPVVLPPE